MCNKFRHKNILDIALLETYKDRIEILYTNNVKQYCYLIYIGLIIDLKRQVLIKTIKANI